MRSGDLGDCTLVTWSSHHFRLPPADMSRIPQSSSSSRTPNKPHASLSPGVPRTRTQSTVTPSSRPSTTPLRTQRSLKSLKPTSKSPVPPSPVPRRPPPAKEETPEPSRPQLSIREQIALKRAAAKKTQTSQAGGEGAFDLGGLEDALPEPAKKNNDDEVDLGRWSVKETIERARSSGEHISAHRRRVRQPHGYVCAASVLRA